MGICDEYREKNLSISSEVPPSLRFNSSFPCAFGQNWPKFNYAILSPNGETSTGGKICFPPPPPKVLAGGFSGRNWGLRQKKKKNESNETKWDPMSLALVKGRSLMPSYMIHLANPQITIFSHMLSVRTYVSPTFQNLSNKTIFKWK